jgi:hypothetical protein
MEKETKEENQELEEEVEETDFQKSDDKLLEEICKNPRIRNKLRQLQREGLI